MGTLFAAIVAILVSSTLALKLQNVFEYEIKEVEKATSFLKQSKLHNIFDLQTKIDNVPIHSKLTAFNWNDCGKPSADVDIKTLSISPDPLSFPGDLDVSTIFKIKTSLISPLQGDIKMSKKMDGKWETIPCIGGFGSCHFDDVCVLLDSIKSSCPPQIKAIGIECECPLKANNIEIVKRAVPPAALVKMLSLISQNTYTLPMTTFDIMAAIIPQGDYQIEANVTKNNEEVAVCLQVQLSIA